MNSISKHFVLGLASLGLVAGCGSQPKPVAVNAPPPPAVVALAAPAAPAVLSTPAAPKDTSVKLTGDNWSFTCPNDNWTEVKTGREEILGMANDASEHRRIMLIAQDFKGPAQIFPLVILSSVKEQGGKVTATKEATINGNAYNYIATSAVESGNPLDVFMWLTVKNGMGYVFMCGGHPADDLSSMCDSVAATLELK
jgi:hypothetical protein